MDNQLFYIKQILQLKEQANEAVKAIKFILNMKCFDPLKPAWAIGSCAWRTGPGAT